MAGSYCTYAVRFDGSVASIGEGSYGRLGHGGSENESNLRNISTLQGIVTCGCVCLCAAMPSIHDSTNQELSGHTWQQPVCADSAVYRIMFVHYSF